MKSIFSALAILVTFSLANAQWSTTAGFETTSNNVNALGGNFFVGENAGAGDARVEVGKDRSSNGNSYFDLVGDVSAFPGYGARLIRWADGRTYFTHRGTNTFGFFCPQGALTVFNNSNKNTMVMTADNKVGIGTNNPESLLSVKGKIESEEVQVKQNVADYVFYDNYQMMSLEELEKYIADNGHLPRIQTQNDVDANRGLVKLGDLTVSLMEKVEELTLHLIEVNKRLSKLEESNK